MRCVIVVRARDFKISIRIYKPRKTPGCVCTRQARIKNYARTINNYEGVRVWLRYNNHCTTCAQYIVLIKMCESTEVLLAP